LVATPQPLAKAEAAIKISASPINRPWLCNSA
jgi:hypothetical protein